MKGKNVKTLEAIKDDNRCLECEYFSEMASHSKNNDRKNTFELISLVYETFPTFNFGFHLSYPLCKLLFEV